MRAGLKVQSVLLVYSLGTVPVYHVFLRAKSVHCQALEDWWSASLLPAVVGEVGSEGGYCDEGSP